ncbi:hypothetical protein MBLNU459_g5957t1 [Dothideomycetes sp. NU459]
MLNSLAGQVLLIGSLTADPSRTDYLSRHRSLLATPSRSRHIMDSYLYSIPAGLHAIPDDLLDLRTDSEVDYDLLHPSPVSHEKNVWFFWHGGYPQMHPYAKRNIRAWHRRFSKQGWVIRVIDRVPDSPLNVAAFLDTSDESTFPRAFMDHSLDGDYALQHTSDLVRWPLLLRYGGVYADVGMIQIGDLDRLWRETIGDPTSRFEVLSYDDSERSFTNYFMACRPCNPFFTRCHQLLLTLWAADGGKTNTEGMHSSPLLKGAPMMGDSTLTFKEKDRTIGHEEAGRMLTDYIIQGQAMTMVMGLVDEEGGWDGPRYVAEHVYGIDFMASVEEAESLFHATYHLYQHKTSSTRQIACDSYSLPAHITSHVDFVMPGVHFDAKTKPDTDLFLAADGTRLEKRWTGNPWSPKHKPYHHYPGPAYPHHRPESGQICNVSFVTPDCLRLLYNVSSNNAAVEGNSLGIVEYTPESYLPSDLDLFFKTYEPAAVGERPIFDSIDAFSYLGEPSLDLQYAMSLVYPQNVILYQVGDLAEEYNTSFNNFLDAIDASYCTYDGGDEQPYDAVYPDPYPGPNSYQGAEDCGTYAAAKVISTSYAYDEIDLPPSYEIRQCHEYMKLGLTGTTFVYSSGDYGVGSVTGGGCLAANGSLNDGTEGQFVPTFPSGCPYVLSAGATQIRNGTYNVDAAIEAGEEVEVVMELYITDDLVGTDVPLGADPIGQVVFSSSGGFSNVFELPSYQASAVTTYLEKDAPDYPGQYNNSGKARGFPDIASNGAWFSIAVDGELSQVFGTSCAAPTIAALLALINGERIKAGKGAVGFINPTLYANPDVLHDITAGGNPGCGTYGFNAVAGWDPATGLGTPNYPEMLELFLSLP